ncbi:hypothetical protein V1477_008497 [Vespula maculifrons]|uniref:Uncharacterized protein n=1 Tax=Vespula maculifrons TaxID=7453 RepID=A0ABD2CD70_VESMC
MKRGGGDGLPLGGDIRQPPLTSQCITEEDLDQLRCRPTSFSTNYESSTLNFDLNRGRLLRHEAKKRLYAVDASTNCGSRGQLLDY